MLLSIFRAMPTQLSYWFQLRRRQLRQRPRATILIDELDEISIGGVEDVDDGSNLAGLQAVVREVGAQLNAFEVTVPARRVAAASCGRTRL